MYSSGRNKIKKTIIMAMVLFFVVETAGLFLIYPEKARAAGEFDAPAFGQREKIFGVDQSVEESRRAADKTEEKVKEVKKSIADKLFKGLILTAAVTLKNTLVMMAKTAAEQSVTYLATGDWGEGPMFYDKAFSTFKEDFVNQAVGQFLDNINDLFGIDICHPEIPFELSAKLFLLKEGYAELKKPDCTLSEFKHNWSAFLENIQNKYKAFKDDPAAFSVGVLQETVTVAFTRESTDIGGLIVLKEKMKQKVADDYNAARDDRVESQGGKPVVDITGGFVETPAYLTRSHSAAELEKAKDTPQSEVNTSKEVLTEIPGQVGVAFFNTFISKFWTDYILAKIFDKGLVSPKPIAGIFDVKGQMKTEFANQKINYSFAQKQIDLLSEFATCTDPRQINNCVMDNDFADAVRQATQDKPLTVAEAITQGMLNGAKHLIGPDDERNNHDDCYEIGYCYSNLVKLRNARIIPIGWEIAAKATKKGKEVTLQEAINNFNISTSTFYHLIDQNWILRYPQTQCKAYVNGPLMVAPKAAERAETCVDATSCLKTDDKGKCLAWGYCAAEKNMFRFSGQSCQGVYDSCLTYKGAKNKEVSYVSNTVDKAYCTADNAGCLWYSKHKSNKAGVLGPWSSGATHDMRIYLNGKITEQECSPKEEGCARFVSTEAGLGTNLLTNSGFEIFEEPIAQLDDVKGWNWYDANNVNSIVKTHPTLSANSFSGTEAAAVATNNKIVSDEIVVAPKPFIRYFALSAQIKKNIDDPVTATVNLNNSANVLITLIYPSNTANNAFTINNKSQWENIKAIFSVGADLNVFTSSIGASGNTVFVDNVLLEELDGPQVASMHVYSDYASQNAVYVKKAPEYLGCYDVTAPAVYGRPKTSADITTAIANDVAGEAKQKGCKDFAQLCTAEDVGCAAYKPTDKGSAINGVVSYSDYCPQECTGYASYSKSATNFENFDFPLYLIPSTAESCSAIDAGCEEFTNLDVLGQGGEAKEYYKELRACVELPEGKSKCSTYYTWEGSEVTGYQLQAHELEKDISDSSPALVDPSYASQCDASIFAKKINPDCRQFFDAAGNAYYKLFSKTVLCTTDCHPYRRTDKYIDNLATIGVNEAKDLCESKKGKFENNECVFMAVPSSSKKCSAQNYGCREYKGNQAGVEFELENYTFSGVGGGSPLEKLKVSLSELKTSPEFGQYLTVKQSGGTSFLETDPAQLILSTGDYRASFWLKKTDASGINNFSVKPGSSSFSDVITENWSFHDYNFTVDASNAAGYKFRIEYQSAFDIDNLKIVKTNDLKYLIRDSWTTPTSCDYKLNSDLTDVANYLPQAQLGCREFKTTDGGTSYLKSLSGLCSAEKVGCTAMIDTQNNEYPFKKEFNKEEFKCDYSVLPNVCSTGLINFGSNCGKKGGTFNSADSSCDYNSDIIVPVDALIYLVVNDKVKCPASEKGCTAVGLPTLTVDVDGKKIVKKDISGVELWSNQFYKLDPENFEEDSKNNPLCKYFESDCEKFDSVNEASSDYFKTPGDKMCEYRQGQLSGGTGVDQKVYAWFKKKTDSKSPDVKCADVKEYYDDGQSNVFRNTEETYSGWTAGCPKSQDKCTAFVDPTDTHSDAVGVKYPKAYYYLNNENIDKSSCTGVSRKEGCVLFNDTSSTELSYGSTITYKNSDDENGGLVPAVSNKEFSDIVLDDGTVCKNKKLNSKYYDCLMVNTVNSDVGKWAKPKCVNDHPDHDNESQNCTDVYYLNHGDTNVKIKVTRDRECSAWYDCKSSHWVWNQNKNKYEEVCDQVGLCDTMNAGSEGAKCERFVDSKDTDNLLSQNNVLTAVNSTFTDKTNYSARPTGWFNFEYTGLAIPDLAPAQYYNALDVAQGSGKKTCGGSAGGADCSKDKSVCNNTGQPCETLVDYRLVNVSDSDVECKTSNIKDDCGDPNYGFCKDTDFIKKATETDQEFKQRIAETCRCLSNVCVKPLGQTFNDSKEPACRAYPEKASPFPASAASNVNFEGANFSYVADKSKDNADFACDYRKQTYGGGAITKYLPRYPQYSPAPPDGYCAEDQEKDCKCESEGEYPIESNTICSSKNCPSSDTEGLCYKRDTKKPKDYTGWEGYCLQEDLSLVKDGLPDKHPCLTWYPTQAMPGLQDFNNQYDDAGFWPANYGFTGGGPYFCTESTRFEFRESWYATSQLQTFYGGQCVLPLVSLDLINAESVKDPETDDVIAIADKGGTLLQNGKKYDLSDNYGDNSYVSLNGGEFVLFEPDPQLVWNKINELNPLTVPPGLCTVSSMPQPKDICTNYVNNLKYDPTNLYDVDWQLAEDLELRFQCVPTNHINGKGWYYDEKEGIDVLYKGNNSGFDTSKDDGDEEAPKEVDVNDPTILLKEDDYGMEKQSCTQLYAVADDKGENKAYTNRIYQQKEFDFSSSPCNSGKNTETNKITIDAGCGANYIGTDGTIKGLYGALSYTKESSTLKDVWNLFLDDKFEKNDGKTNQSCISIEGETTALETPYGSGVEWGNANIYQGGISCLDTDDLKTLFTKSYGLWNQTFSAADTCVKNAYGTCAGTNLTCWTVADCNTSNKECIPFVANVSNGIEDCKTKIINGKAGNLYESNICYRYQDVKGNDCMDLETKIGDKPTASDAFKYTDDNVGTWDTASTGNNPPTISAVVATTKVDSNGKTIYAAVPNKITVTTPDVEKTSGDIVYYGNQLPVSVKFYAWADDDHMPLRSVIVKFEDGIPPAGSSDGSSKFKNYKPRCQDDANQKMGTCNAPGAGKYYRGYACLDDSECSHLKNTETPCIMSGEDAAGYKYFDDRFGDTEQACHEGYFQYNHTYTCEYGTDFFIDGKSVKACKFEIGVQAKDNWGWCNGNHKDPNSGPEVDGSKGAYADAAQNGCSTNLEKPFEWYDGYIYIIP